MCCYTDRVEKEWQEALARQARREEDQNTRTSKSYQFSESNFPSLPMQSPSSRMVKIMANKKEEIVSEPIGSSEHPPSKKLKEEKPSYEVTDKFTDTGLATPKRDNKTVKEMVCAGSSTLIETYNPGRSSRLWFK